MVRVLLGKAASERTMPAFAQLIKGPKVDNEAEGAGVKEDRAIDVDVGAAGAKAKVAVEAVVVGVL